MADLIERLRERARNARREGNCTAECDARLYEEAAAALEAAREDAWQPIETAPKDGTWVLLYDEEVEGNPYLHAQWDEMFGAWTSRRTRSGKSILWTWEPPHWRPLPTPPAIDQARGKGEQPGETM